MLWEVAPEVRYYMGEKKAWYVGAMFKAGEFNYKALRNRQAGRPDWRRHYRRLPLWLNKALNLDFNLGLGYLNADFEKYEVIDGVCEYAAQRDKGLVGPHQCRCDIGMEVILTRRNRI